MRIILYTGKGGVGKTCVAAATALHLADAGRRVLVASTDIAHSLGDAFDRPVGSEPVSVAPNLDALEIDPVVAGREAWGQLQAYLRVIMTSHGGSADEAGIEVDELFVFPGLEELLALSVLLDIEEAGAYDVLVVDCAPTGETLSLLKYPERFGSFIEQALPLKRTALKVGRPVIERVMNMPMPPDTIFDEISALVNRLERLRALLVDADRTSLRVVTTPERIVVQEAKRAFAWLHLYGYNVDAVVVNRLYPDDALAGYFERWSELQRVSLAEIEEGFAGVPVLRLMLRHSELRGLPGLREAAAELYAGVDPEPVLARADAVSVHECNDGWELSLAVPFFDKQDLGLRQDGDTLLVAARNQSRRIPLPEELWGRTVTGARYENGCLVVHFVA
ncbi:MULTISPECIES: ArsA family ATPase [Gordonibacter]|uniref:ArsA family ATPase n=1 Tax=Gordonibacter faecis TaxID=3047475 RepID=A0ABT7DK66_9ACTN|nr:MULTISPECIES: ArsA family ATPase [unclassified Gordonibacter]MDJ1649911.1 ArsA family ATPase [Gordonibacter sp. KGMB12511]